MLQRGIENARFPRFPVDAGHGQGHQVMVGSDAARHRDDGGTVAHHREEQCVLHVQKRQVRHGLHDAERHEQVHGPDAHREEQESSLVRHVVETAEALSHRSQSARDLAAEPVPVAITEDGPEKECDEQHDGHKHPPEGELQPGGHGLPDLLREERAELVPVKHQRNAQHEENRHDVPKALHQYRAEHGAEGGLAAYIAAAEHFASPGKAQVGEVTHIVGIPRLQPAGLQPR